jgi:hypothetical protein
MKTNWFDLKWSELQKIDNTTGIEKLSLLLGTEVEELNLSEAKKLIDDGYWNEPIPTVNPMYIRLSNGEVVTPVSLSSLSVAEYEDATQYLKENNIAAVMSILYRPFKLSWFNKQKLHYYLAKAEKVMNNSDAFTAALTKVISLPKEIEKYDYSYTDARIALFEELPVPYVHSASVFFCLLSIQLGISTNLSLIPKVEEKVTD